VGLVGRGLSLGFYKTMGLRELVVRNAKEFVNLNLEIANDREFKAALAEKVSKRVSSIAEDLDATRELENIPAAL
jgi:predicted O-linked N-acetylglucosamine transferase (SPINDLY family)